MEVSFQLHIPANLPPGKEPLYTMDRRMDVPQRWSECNGKEKKVHSLPPAGIEPHLSSL